MEHIAMVATDKQTNNEELLQLAITTAKNGQQDSARVMFQQVWSRDKRSERAMVWLAKLAKTPEEKREWLNRLLKVNPEHEAARIALKKMEHERAARDNRTLLLFGAVAVIMILIVVVVLALALAG
jgi:cob(I)alamin adenosyltransferase